MQLFLDSDRQTDRQTDRHPFNGLYPRQHG